jgi:hypothetical protein
MNIKNGVFCILSLLVVSCGSYQYRDDYYSVNRNDNEQCFFIVDTIEIPDPIIMKEKGDFFIVPKSALYKETKKIEDLYKNTDVYIACFDEFFFYKYLSKKKLPQYVNRVSFYSETEKITINGKIYEKFKNPNVSFILGLIKINYYNTVMANACGEWYMIKNRKYKNSYYRIVFPIIKQKRGYGDNGDFW